ncbi:AAA family ATPase [Tolypothrix sp. VBCCA 56010]|uniref:AAA family ATPase n=1 Tax=Tolypothrix sp. VBCCA 56010 TaxID=3137731 RepID=UPI003D7D18AC
MTAICHFLIGIPGSGKSTLAQKWVKKDSNTVIVSTDDIRAELFGSEQVQGNWKLVEEELLTKVKTAITSGRSVIYDATNVKRAWRMDTLQKFASVGVKICMAWYLKTPLEECYRRNQQRQRQVDEKIIASYADLLKQFEPIKAEDFAQVTEIPMVNGEFDLEKIQMQIQKLPRAITNRHNRNQGKILHQYCQLLDFERLMHLIALLLKYPGAGLLHVTHPEFLQKLTGNTTSVTDSLFELSALMARQYHPIYANSEALAKDLGWLEKNGIIGESGLEKDIEVSDYTGDISQFNAHTYSDIDLFVRLLKIIRCMVHYPCFRYEEGAKSQETFYENLQLHIYGISQSQLRKDIERVLHPYKILPNTAMKRAYFLGTAILAKHELAEVFNVLRSHVHELDDPIAFSTYEAFEKKLELSQLVNLEHFGNTYAVRAIASQPIVDINTLPDYTAYKKLDEITDAIISGRVLLLDRFLGAGSHVDNPHANESFQVLPLQIVFYNIGWYLGYECKDGENAGLFKFERLDRIFIRQKLNETRSFEKQKQALLRLETLYKASYSLFIGNRIEEQKKYLDNKQRSSVEILLEIWCNDIIFRFISEGTKRFPPEKIKMSKRFGVSQQADKKMFALPQTGDSQFPHRFQVILPSWSVEDVDLRRWIVGFGGNIKVMQPQALVKQVKVIGDAISHVYSNL